MYHLTVGNFNEVNRGFLKPFSSAPDDDYALLLTSNRADVIFYFM